MGLATMFVRMATLPPRAPPFYTPPRRKGKVCIYTILFNACPVNSEINQYGTMITKSQRHKYILAMSCDSVLVHPLLHVVQIHIVRKRRVVLKRKQKLARTCIAIITVLQPTQNIHRHHSLRVESSWCRR